MKFWICNFCLFSLSSFYFNSFYRTFILLSRKGNVLKRCIYGRIWPKTFGIRYVYILSYLHFIRHARLKSIRSFEWYLPINRRPNHFWCRSIRTTFFPWQHSKATPVYSFIMGIPTLLESNKFEKIPNLFRAVMWTLINIVMFLIHY